MNKKLNFEGKEYTLIDEAYIENYKDGSAVFQRAKAIEDGEEVDYLVRWDYIEADDIEDCADWDNPVSVEEY